MGILCSIFVTFFRNITMVYNETCLYYIFWVCVCSISYPACKVHAQFYIVICGLSGCTTFSHIISETERFLGKKLVNIKSVFWFSLYNFVWNIFHSKKHSVRYYSYVHRSSRKVPVILVKFWWNKFSKITLSNFTNICWVAAELFQADRWTGRQVWWSQ